MKLKFRKNEKGEILVEVDGKSFSTKDYIEMIKEIKNEKKIEAEFEKNITNDERNYVESMLNDLNKINETTDNAVEDYDEAGEAGDLPF